VVPSTDAFPQKTPREALASVIRAIEKGRIDYLAAHLIDPGFVDAKVIERAELIELDVEKDLLAERDSQRLLPPRDRPPLPQDALAFREAVRLTARERAFRLIVRDVQQTIAENPEINKDFRKFLRNGTFVDAGEASSVSHREIPGRQIFFRRVDGRWYVEDRQKPEPGEVKKEGKGP
jgi:hypothetical protein